MHIEDAVIIICSTPNSTRLPKKCFLPINGKRVLNHILDRLKPLDIHIILAVPLFMKPDDAYEYKNIASNYNKVQLCSGSNDSPLHRMIESLNECYVGQFPKYVIRITHDDVIIDAQTIYDMYQEMKKRNVGYAISPGIVEGAGVEIIHIANLTHAAQTHVDPIEHISYFVKGQGLPEPDIYRHVPREGVTRPYRLTLDYYEDYVVLENILRKLGNDCSVDDICEYIDLNMGVIKYNRLPEISVYTCAYNADDFITYTIDSVFHGTNSKEYILVDDASSDNTLEEILNYPVACDLTVHVNNRNIGLASSSNIAVTKARGKYIMRIDADDMIKLNTIKRMREEMERTNSVICYANYDEIDEDNNIVRKNVSAKEHHHAGCALMNKRWLNELRFKDGIRHWDSLELYQRIKDKFPVAYITEPLWYYRVHHKSLSRNNIEEREKLKPAV